MNFKKAKLLALMTAAGLGLGMSGMAQASAYGVAYNNVYDFTIDIVGTATMPNAAFTSEAHADRNGVNINGGGINILDAPVQCLGTACVNDAYTTVGATGTTYGLGDAIIDNPNVGFGDPNGPGQARNIAEASAYYGDAGATGTNQLSSDLLVGAGGATLTFDFLAAPYIGVITTAIGENVQAGISFSITISDGQNDVFAWAPGGSAGGIIGGIENSDPMNLQAGRSLGSPNNQVFDPYGYGVAAGTAGFAFPQFPADIGNRFNASTALLGEGVYTLTVLMNESVNVDSPIPVPAPASLLLMGMGLVGLGYRRKRV